MRIVKVCFFVVAFLLLLPAVFGALVTVTKSVCNSGDANVTWTSDNTYFLNVDGNVDIENCQLTINAGTVVKFKSDENKTTSLRIWNKGVLKAQGTSASKIVFTSQNDNSIGTIATDSNGTPNKADYNSAIWFSSTAGITSDANRFSDLNIGYARQAIAIYRYIGSIHDNNLHDNNASTNGGAGVFVNALVNNFYNNTIRDNNATTGRGAGVWVFNFGGITNFYNNTITNNVNKNSYGAVSILGGITTNFYNNTITKNKSAGYGGGVNNGVAITNFYNNIITHNAITDNSGAGGGVNLGTANSITNFYNNTISNNRTEWSNVNGGGIGITTAGFRITNFYNNTIEDNNTVGGNGGGIYNIGTITNFYNNSIRSNLTSTTSDRNGGGIYNIGNIENFYNNIIRNNTAKNGAGLWDRNIISNFYNNTFFNNSATVGGAIFANDSNGILLNFYNNIFAYNKGTAVYNLGGQIDGNFNAFWANDTNTSGYTEGTQSIFLGATPFADDYKQDTNNDRNFLLNSYGIAQLQGKGNSSTGTDSFFSARTVRFDNRLDYNRSIGWHADQNSPFVSVLTPNVGTYSGNVLIDFNVSSNGQNADVNVDLNVVKSAVLDQNVFYLKQAFASWTCNQSLPATTMDVNCTYVLNSTTIADTNYLARAQATDKNGIGRFLQLNSFATDNTSPDMNNDVNTNWQNKDANVRIWCNDVSKGNSDINSIAINKDNNGWLFFSKSALSVKRIDHNALFTTDMNHKLQYFCNDSRGNTTDTNTTYVLIDKTSPILSLTVTSITTTGLNATITFTGSATGGIRNYWISIDSGNNWTNNGTSTSYTFSLSSGTMLPFTQTLWIKATNNADQNTLIQTASIRFESASAGTTQYCGDGKCSSTESPSTCPQDCAGICGDRACTGTENTENCPEDCVFICGDNYCTETEDCENCETDCGKCFAQPIIEGIIIEQIVQDVTPTQNQVFETLKKIGLEQLIEQAIKIRENYEIDRNIIVSQLANETYKTTIIITVHNKNNLLLTGLVLLEIVPKNIAQNATEIISENDYVVLQEDPIIEFVALGKIEEKTSFSYYIKKRITDLNAFQKPIILNQKTQTKTSCETGCDDSNPCTKEQCINQQCIPFLLPDETPCGYAQKCKKGLCIAFPTKKYEPPLLIFGQTIEVIILTIGVILLLASIWIRYTRYKTKNK